MSGKHNTYFELRDALARPGCVVCRLAARSVRRYLEALSFESVNDYGLRAQLRQTRGFCNLHAWQLLDEVRDPFGAGIIYRDVLNECTRIVAAGRVEALAAQRACPACEERARSAARYVDVLVEHLDEPAMAGALERAGGLCWRHFALGIARAGRGIRRLAEVEERALAGLLGGATDTRGRTEPGSARPAPGVRAGNAAPRPAPDEVVGDALVAAAVGLPEVVGPAVSDLEAGDWGGGPLAEPAGRAPEASVTRGGERATNGIDAEEIDEARCDAEDATETGRRLEGGAPDAAPSHERASPVGGARAKSAVLCGGTDAAMGAEDECAVCATARRVAARAAGSLGSAKEPGAGTRDRGGPAARAAGARASMEVGPSELELCAPHAWLAAERVGTGAVRAWLEPGLQLLRERIEASRGALIDAVPFTLGSLELATPGMRRRRGELALRLAPGRGCAICAAQLAAEVEAPAGSGDGPLCRPHLLAAARGGALTLTFTQRERGRATVDRWRAIVADLDEYIRKNDYRFRDEPRGDEQRAPWRAVAMVAAGRGLR